MTNGVALSVRGGGDARGLVTQGCGSGRWALARWAVTWSACGEEESCGPSAGRNQLAHGAGPVREWGEGGPVRGKERRRAGPGVRKWAGEKKTREGERAAVWAGLLGWVGLSSFSFF